jgi:uncharacterized protein
LRDGPGEGSIRRVPPMKAMATVLAIAFVGLVFLGLITLRQDRLLYFPDRATVAQVAGAGLQAWPSVQDFHGLVAEPAGAARSTRTHCCRWAGA